MFATFILVWFHTTTLPKDDTLSDSIHLALDPSVYPLLCAILFAGVVATLWLAILRESVRVLGFSMLIATPVSLIVLCAYTLANIYRGV